MNPSNNPAGHPANNPAGHPANNPGSPNGCPLRAAQGVNQPGAQNTGVQNTGAHSLPALLIPEDYRARAVALHARELILRSPQRPAHSRRLSRPRRRPARPRADSALAADERYRPGWF